MGSVQPRIFISHSSTDLSFVRKLADDLQHAPGNERAVWYDAHLEGGEYWWRKIVEELRRSTIFLIVCSPAAMTSDWVNDEIDLAWRLKNSPTRMRVIPLLYQPCQLRYDLENLQVVRFLAPRLYQDALQELLQTLSISQDTPEQSVTETQPEPEARKEQMLRISRRMIIPGLALVGLAVVGGGIARFASLPFLQFYSTGSSTQRTPQLTKTGSNTPTLARGMWSPTGSLLLGRHSCRATVLKNGLVLIEGGATPASYTKESELFDPKTGRWRLTGSLQEGRGEHTATLLNDGHVLVAGGFIGGGVFLNSAEIYDPVTEQWVQISPMSQRRTMHTATLLPNGKVLVAGGWNGAFSSGHIPVPLDSAELYDPTTGMWSSAGTMHARRTEHVAVPLPDGQILVAGGISDVAITELYNPSTNSWKVTSGSMNIPRAGSAAVLLPNQKNILILGGAVKINKGGFTNTAEIYNLATGRWSLTQSMTYSRSANVDWNAVVLKNGTVLVAEGGDGNSSGTSEIYNPVSHDWSSPLLVDQPALSRCRSAITLLADGRVLVLGGYDCSSSGKQITFLTSCDIYTPI